MQIATDLVNTRARGEERLHGPDDLRRFLLNHAEPEPVTVTAAELRDVQGVRERLRVVFGADREEDAAAVLNALLAEHATRPYLSAHDGTPWHLHVTTADADWARWMAATTAMGLSAVAAGYGFDALRSCAADGCDVVFVTTAPRRIRRFCSQTCATRTRVTSYRSRHRGSRSIDLRP